VKALLLTNEYPPHVYGGAGVHVDYLSRELARLIDVEVRCFGEQELRDGALRVHGYAADARRVAAAAQELRAPLDALARCIDFAATPIDADVVHCHTWYSHFGGIVAKLLYGLPLVITTHSLEPSRSWKREQLGRGYDLSTWVEKTALEMADAVVAVSRSMREDTLRLFAVDPARVSVIYNGIDADEYRPVETRDQLARYGIDPAVPYVLFVGRVTRQKGILHLLAACEHLPPGTQVVLCAGAPDTPQIADAVRSAVGALQRRRPGVVWIAERVDRSVAIELYSHAAVFCCPSIYEPFGIINLEAMACGTAVVASAVGGIPEIVVPEETGLLVPFAAGGDGEPIDAPGYARDLAAALDRLLGDAPLRRRMGEAGRARVLREFTWSAIARRVVALYESLAGLG
jgi:alpha-maltose-1-phosphate synthase